MPRRPATSRLARLVVAVCALAGGLSFAAPPAPAAADATLSLTISPTVVTVQSGSVVTFTLSYECSALAVGGACRNARITVPTTPDWRTTIVTGDASFIASGSYGGTPTWVAAAGDLPAGTAGQLTFTGTFGDRNTPDGHVIDVLAGFTADGAAASAGATVNLTSTTGVFARKTLSGPPSPVPGTDVTYFVGYGQTGNWDSNAGTVVDQLPHGAAYVSSTNGGVYDPVAETVTWTFDRNVYPGNGSLSSGCGITGAGTPWCNSVTVRYSPSSFGPGDIVTNAMTVTAWPDGYPAYVHTASSQIAHGFALAQPGTVYRKTIYNPNVVRNLRFGWAHEIHNTGNVSIGGEIIDNVPCPAAPLTLLAAPCTTPGFKVSLIEFNQYAPITIDWVTNTGTTGTYTVPNPGAVPGGSRTVTAADIGVPAGESLGWYRAVYAENIPAGAYANLNVYGKIDPTWFPADTVTITNCGSWRQIYQGVLGPANTDADRFCPRANIVEPVPSALLRKHHLPSATVDPGTSLTYVITFVNNGSADLHPVLTDLLPAGLQWTASSQSVSIDGAGVDGTITGGSAGAAPTATGPIFTEVPNWSGTGRTLVSVTWPAGTTFGPGGSLDWRIGTTVPLATSSVSFNNCAQATDASTAAISLQACDVATVTSTPTAQATKTVRGDQDAGFSAAGTSAANGTATWKISFRNAGNVPLSNFVGYDVLPYVGDHGITDGQIGSPRGSEYATPLTSPVIAPAGVIVSYSTSTNPCRPEVATAAGCIDDWTTTFPGPSTAALRFDLSALTLQPGEVVDITYVTDLPSDATAAERAWNSVAYRATRADVGIPLLASEPPKVSIQVLDDRPRVTIGDRVWHDLDADGVQEAGEPGVSGVTVRLFDVDGAPVATATTDAGGNYLFTGLVPGTYHVAIDVPPGMFVSPSNTTVDSLDSDADAAGVMPAVDLPPGATDLSHDAGLWSAAPAISLLKYTNGTDNDLAPGLEVAIGSQVTWDYYATNMGNTPLIDPVLSDDRGVAVSFVSGDVDGNGLLDVGETWHYRGTGVATPGQYTNIGTVTAQPTAPWAPTQPLTIGRVSASNPDNYFGVAATANAAVGDLVWSDADGNGRQDPGEPGVPGVRVQLYDGSGLVAETTTDADGWYRFDGLPAGTYHVQVIVPGDHVVTRQDGAGDDVDSDVDAAGITAWFSLDVGEVDLDWDAGLLLVRPSIAIVKYTNGTDNDVMPGIELHVGDPVVWTYVVTNTSPTATPIADVRVVDDKEGTATYVSGDADGDGVLDVDEQWTFTLTGVAGADQYTNTGTVTGTGTYPWSPTTPIAGVGQLSASNPDNYFGIGEPGPTNSIGDFVWLDADADGVQDPGEAGVGLVQVDLIDADGAVVGTTVTASDGSYLFSGLPDGKYVVVIVVPAGFQLSPRWAIGDRERDADADASGRTDEYALVGGVTDRSADFGLHPDAPPTTTTPDTTTTTPDTTTTTPDTTTTTIVQVQAPTTTVPTTSATPTHVGRLPITGASPGGLALVALLCVLVGLAISRLRRSAHR